MRVLITGMSGTGKSSVVRELRRRGYAAYDADDDGYTEPASGGSWRWRLPLVVELLASFRAEVVFFAGCSDEQTRLDWDCIVLLAAPELVIAARLAARSSNTYGKSESELASVLRNLREVEPMLRLRADVVVDASQPLDLVVDHVLRATFGITSHGELR